MWLRVIRFFIYNPFLVLLLMCLIGVGGVLVSPLRMGLGGTSPMAIDALPDLSENQHVLRTIWPGQTAERIEQQLNYGLSAHLLGVSGVHTVRGIAMFGVSFLYVIFDDKLDFHTARTRLAEQLSNLPQALLPEGVKPQLGPEATALGQIYMYTLGGRDSTGQPAGGWGLATLRELQDFQIKQQLMAVPGVAEVASIGGYERAFEVVADPLRLQAQGVSILALATALRHCDIEVGAQTLEMNQVAYVIQGLARVKSIKQLEDVLVYNRMGTPIRVRDVAVVQAASLPRRALLDYEGAEAVGGIVTMNYGANATAVLAAIHEKVKEIEHTLPETQLSDGRRSKLHILPYYDRSQLIEETLGTLSHALVLEVLITVLVILWLLGNLRGALLIAGLLPFSVLVVFLCMYAMDIQVHIVSLAGIAIAIGTIVDMGTWLWDNVQRHAKEAPQGTTPQAIVLAATTELLPTLRTAMGSTLIAFLPVFALEASAGRLFHPLAWTKTFTMLAAFLLTLHALPACFALLLRNRHIIKPPVHWLRYVCMGLLVGGGIGMVWWPFLGSLCCCVGLAEGLKDKQQAWTGHVADKRLHALSIGVYVVWLLFAFSRLWLPLGTAGGFWGNLLLASGCVGGLLGALWCFVYFYDRMLLYSWHRRLWVIGSCAVLVTFGLLAVQGVDGVLGKGNNMTRLRSYFPGIAHSFMPPLEEGSFLLMPISTPQGSLTNHKHILQKLDKRLANIPEVEEVVGKLGRAETALDPAPMHMFEIIINYKTKYIQNKDGTPVRFAVDKNGTFLRDSHGELLPDDKGSFYRNWRPEVHNVADIWAEVAHKQLPTLSRAPRLQPIETRLLMQRTGIQAPLALKVVGATLADVASFAQAVAPALQGVAGIQAGSVYAEPTIGSPYIQLVMRPEAAQRFGLQAKALGDYIQIAIGGTPLHYLRNGHIRWPLLLRYGADIRDNPVHIMQLPIQLHTGAYVPLSELVTLHYAPGPQMIRSENGWPVTYVLFTREENTSATMLVKKAEAQLKKLEKKGALTRPKGVSYTFEGTYKETLRAEKRFVWVIAISLFLVFILLYLQFRKVLLSLAIFSNLLLVFAGGFLLLWVYQQLGEGTQSTLGAVFGIGHPVSLNTAVWVGFVALFGIAVDNGIVMAFRLEKKFEHTTRKLSKTMQLQALCQAGRARLRPCLITTASTLLALLPLLAAQGKGGELMRAMALPIIGGMLISPLSLFTLPIFYGYLLGLHKKHI